MTLILYFFLPLVITVLLTAIGTRLLFPQLAKKKLGQKILEIGPRWHKNKEGTPTMGGIIFPVIALTVGGVMTAVCNAERSDILPLFFLFLYALLNALIGMADDLTKFKKHENEGLTPGQKIILQSAAGALFLFLMHRYAGLSTFVTVPFTGISLELGFAYDFIMLFLLLGIVNCVNLSDGIDGLCATVTAVTGFFYAASAMLLTVNALYIPAFLLSGIGIGFLLYNAHPARIFMGDTGSLFFGAMIAGSAFLLGEPLILLPLCIVFEWEGISDILQVLYYKITKKRLFLMAPFHHHLEKRGYSENRIVILFLAVAILGAIGAYSLLFAL